MPRCRRGSSCWPSSRSPPSLVPVAVVAALVARRRWRRARDRCSPRPPPARPRSLLLDVAARRPGRGPGRARRRRVADLDPVPVARLRRRGVSPAARSASRGCRGAGGAPPTPRSWSLVVDDGRRRAAPGCPSCASPSPPVALAGAAVLVAVGAPNRRPTPAAVAAALGDAGLDAVRGSSSSAPPVGGPSCTGRRRRGTARSSRSTARTAATPTCSTAPTARWCCATPATVAVAVARRDVEHEALCCCSLAARGGVACPSLRAVVALARRLDGAGHGRRRRPPARRARAPTSSTPSLLDAVWRRSRAARRRPRPRRAARRQRARRRDATGDAVLIDLGAGTRRGRRPRPGDRPGRAARLARRARRAPTPPSPSAARALDPDDLAAAMPYLQPLALSAATRKRRLEVDAASAARARSPRRRGTSPCRSSGSSGCGRGPSSRSPR